MDNRPPFYTCYFARLDPTSRAHVCCSRHHMDLLIVEGFENIPIITMGINPAIEIHSLWNPDSSILKETYAYEKTICVLEFILIRQLLL